MTIDKKFKNKWQSEFDEIDPLTYSKSRSDLLARLVHDGMVFSSGGSFELDEQSNRTFVFVTGDISPHVKKSKTASDKSDVTIDYYEDSLTSDNGTVTQAANHNRVSSRTSSTRMYTDPTVTDDGNLLSQQLITEAQLFVDELVEGFVLKPNTKYVIRFFNNSQTKKAVIHFDITWYEIQYVNPITIETN